MRIPDQLIADPRKRAAQDAAPRGTFTGATGGPWALIYRGRLRICRADAPDRGVVVQITAGRGADAPAAWISIVSGGRWSEPTSFAMVRHDGRVRLFGKWSGERLLARCVEVLDDPASARAQGVVFVTE